MTHQIAFEGIGLEFTLNRVAFSIGSKPIYWYGIIIAAGFLLAAMYTMRRAPQFGGLPSDSVLDMLLFATPVAIVCARAYYVAFEWPAYRGHFYKTIAIWEGGLAIYGGVIGAMLTVAVFCKVKKLSPLDMLDVGVLGLLIGQSIGRWGNFVNAEAFGGPTDSLLRMSIDGAAAVHPTFLYESLWNAAGFVLLHLISRRRHFKGEILLGYIIWYGLGRTWIEGLRADSLYLGATGIRVSQLLAGVSCLIAAVLLIIRYRKYNFDKKLQ